ncbi:MAG: PH domain-containing protein [Patescibacteria group bacterium]|jgi:uncharacterized membrane protein YdbT with pleckstrin-like domain
MLLSTFIHQKTYEKIVYKLRKHPIITVPSLLFFGVLLLLPTVFYWFAAHNFANIFENEILIVCLTLLAGIYYLAAGLFYFTYFVNFYLDLLVITNDRLLHIEQEGVFSRTISEVDLYKIQDITSTINGFIPSLFDFGDLLIQTAGAVEKFMITNVPDPEHLRQHILDLAEEDRKFHNANGTATSNI